MMNFSHDRAFERRIVICAGQWDHALLAGEGINDQALKFWGNDLVILGQKENSGRMNVLCVGKTVEIAWDSQGDRSGQEPKIPPAVVA